MTIGAFIPSMFTIKETKLNVQILDIISIKNRISNFHLSKSDFRAFNVYKYGGITFMRLLTFILFLNVTHLFI